MGGGEKANKGETGERSARGEMDTGTGVLLSDTLPKTVIRQQREKRYRHQGEGGQGVMEKVEGGKGGE